MKKSFVFENLKQDLELLFSRTPVSEKVRSSLIELSLHDSIAQGKLSTLGDNVVVAATDPWDEVEYQSLSLRGDDPENRVVLHMPTSQDPVVGTIILKSARMSGEPGLVYCGTKQKLQDFARKLAEYEKRGAELNNFEFLDALIEAAEADGLKIIYHQVEVETQG